MARIDSVARNRSAFLSRAAEHMLDYGYKEPQLKRA
jgi:hypothetical protein